MTIVKKLLILLASAIVTYSVLYTTESLSDQYIQPAHWSFYSQIIKEQAKKKTNSEVDLSNIIPRQNRKSNQTENTENKNILSTVSPTAANPTSFTTGVATHQSLSRSLTRERKKQHKQLAWNIPIGISGKRSLSTRTQRDENNIGSYDITTINSGFAAAPNLQGGNGATAIDPGKNNPTTKIPVGNGMSVMLIMAVSYVAIRFRK